MEKMNQVSVSEFFTKSKEEMYDMAVDMVEKYNRLVDICNDSAERISELVIERDNLSKGVQKLIGERDDLIERHATYTSALNKDIADKAAKIELMQQEIDGRKTGYVALKTQMDILKKECDRYANDVMEKCTYIDTLKQDIEDMEEETEKLKETIKTKDEEITKRCKDIISQSGTICNLKKELDARGEEIKKLNECIMNKNKSINTANDAIVNLRKEIGAHEEENKRLSEKIIELKKERDKHMARVNDLRMGLDCAKASKEKHEEAAHDKVVEDLRETITYWRNKYVAAQEEIEKLDGTIEEWKNQERIRTDQLRATESKVEELWEEIERLRDLGEHWKRSYFNIRYSLNKLKDKSKEDDHGRKGFKEYIKWIVKEEEAKYKESWKARLNKELATIFEEEETIKYRPSEIDRFINFLKDEVDKKRIVDIGEGAEKIIGVSRELFDAAIKALVDDGYQEIIGRIPQATNSYIYMDMHVLATPDVETKETANAENIKSLDFDIPCGEDAIE